MATGFGVDPTKRNDGVITSGTTSEDIRRIIGSLMSPGIVGDTGLVTLSKTDLTATVSAGSVVIPTGSKEAVIAPIPNTKVSLGAPIAGAQSWKIYVKQNFPSTDGDSEVIVAATSGTVPPNNTLILDVIEISSGMTVASSGISRYDKKFSIPYGSNGGAIGWFTDTSNAILDSNHNEWVHVWTHNFNLATDRKIKVEISPTLSAYRADKVTPARTWNPDDYTEMAYRVDIDGRTVVRFNTPGLTRSWTTYYFQHYENLLQGSHTLTIYMARVSGGPGYPKRWYSGSDINPGTKYVLRDAGTME